MKNKLSIAMTLAVILAMLVTSLALADNVGADNDITSPGNQNSVNLTATPSGTVTTSAQLVVDYQGSRHLIGGSTLVLQVGTNNLPVGYTVSEVTSTVPNPWNADVAQFVAGNSSISFTAPSIPGDYVYTVKWDDKTKSCTSGDCVSSGNAFTINLTVSAPADTTPPVWTVPADFSVEATGPSGAVVTYSASANDPDDAVSSQSCLPASGSTFPLGTTTVNCTATDTHSNTGTASFNVTVVDTTPPAVTVPADITAEATGPSGAVVSFSASASDIVDGAITPTCAPASGSTFALGTILVTCSATDAHGNTGSATFNVTVQDTTPPTITFVSRLPAANSFGWNNTDVTVTWSCSDIVGVVSPTVSQTVSTEGSGLSATGTCVDTSGNTASATQGNINIDKTKPSASASRTPAANSFGWNNNDVTVSFSGTDDRSGIDTCSANQVFGEGAGQSASGTCTDKAGNVSDPATVNDINVDKTAPTISGAPDRAANVNGWYNADVTVSFTCDDALSGVDACTAPVTLGEGAGQSVPGSVTDNAGNSASTTVSGINIDKTAPIFGTCPSGGPFILNSGLQPVGPISVDATISGLNAGVSTLSGFVDTSSIGLKTVNFTAVDNADNSASKSCSYSVIYDWHGFFQPIDNDKLNVAKAGSAIPVKFSLSGYQGLNIFATGYPRSVKIVCDTNTLTDEIETTVTAGGSSLNYDALVDQYIYVWKTDKSWAGTCRQLQVKLNDDTLHVANFKFK